MNLHSAPFRALLALLICLALLPVCFGSQSPSSQEISPVEQDLALHRPTQAHRPHLYLRGDERWTDDASHKPAYDAAYNVDSEGDHSEKEGVVSSSWLSTEGADPEPSPSPVDTSAAEAFAGLQRRLVASHSLPPASHAFRSIRVNVPAYSPSDQQPQPHDSLQKSSPSASSPSPLSLAEADVSPSISSVPPTFALFGESGFMHPSEPNFWFYVGICAALVLTGGLFSGLTIGLMSLSTLELQVLAGDSKTDEGTKKSIRKLETIIRPSRHHLLLVTLLLGNSIAMESLPLFLDALVPAWLAIMCSVTFVLIFGEILPQAICTRNPLKVGTICAPFVRFCMLVMLPVSYPIAKILDWVLGVEGGAHFLSGRSQLATLLQIEQNDKVLNHDETRIMKSVLELRDEKVEKAMTKINEVFMVEWNEVLDHKKMQELLSLGHSRVPVYQGHRANIKSILLVKSLIVVNPSDGHRVCDVLDIAPRPPLYVSKDTELLHLLDEFLKAKLHMAIVTSDVEAVEKAILAEEDVPSFVQILGLITIEDVLEALLDKEIDDEFDAMSALAGSHSGVCHAQGRRNSAKSRWRWLAGSRHRVLATKYSRARVLPRTPIEPPAYPYDTRAATMTVGESFKNNNEKKNGYVQDVNEKKNTFVQDANTKEDKPGWWRWATPKNNDTMAESFQPLLKSDIQSYNSIDRSSRDDLAALEPFSPPAAPPPPPVPVAPEWSEGSLSLPAAPPPPPEPVAPEWFSRASSPPAAPLSPAVPIADEPSRASSFASAPHSPAPVPEEASHSSSRSPPAAPPPPPASVSPEWSSRPASQPVSDNSSQAFPGAPGWHARPSSHSVSFHTQQAFPITHALPAKQERGDVSADPEDAGGSPSQSADRNEGRNDPSHERSDNNNSSGGGSSPGSSSDGGGASSGSGSGSDGDDDRKKDGGGNDRRGLSQDQASPEDSSESEDSDASWVEEGESEVEDDWKHIQCHPELSDRAGHTGSSLSVPNPVSSQRSPSLSPSRRLEARQPLGGVNALYPPSAPEVPGLRGRRRRKRRASSHCKSVASPLLQSSKHVSVRKATASSSEPLSSESSSSESSSSSISGSTVRAETSPPSPTPLPQSVSLPDIAGSVAVSSAPSPTPSKLLASLSLDVKTAQSHPKGQPSDFNLPPLRSSKSTPSLRYSPPMPCLTPRDLQHLETFMSLAQLPDGSSAVDAQQDEDLSPISFKPSPLPPPRLLASPSSSSHNLSYSASETHQAPCPASAPFLHHQRSSPGPFGLRFAEKGLQSSTLPSSRSTSSSPTSRTVPLSAVPHPKLSFIPVHGIDSASPLPPSSPSVPPSMQLRLNSLIADSIVQPSSPTARSSPRPSDASPRSSSPSLVGVRSPIHRVAELIYEDRHSTSQDDISRLDSEKFLHDLQHNPHLHISPSPPQHPSNAISHGSHSHDIECLKKSNASSSSPSGIQGLKKENGKQKVGEEEVELGEDMGFTPSKHCRVIVSPAFRETGPCSQSHQYAQPLADPLIAQASTSVRIKSAPPMRRSLSCDLPSGTCSVQSALPSLRRMAETVSMPSIRSPVSLSPPSPSGTGRLSPLPQVSSLVMEDLNPSAVNISRSDSQRFGQSISSSRERSSSPPVPCSPSSPRTRYLAPTYSLGSAVSHTRYLSPSIASQSPRRSKTLTLPNRRLAPPARVPSPSSAYYSHSFLPPAPSLAEKSPRSPSGQEIGDRTIVTPGYPPMSTTHPTPFTPQVSAPKSPSSHSMCRSLLSPGRQSPNCQVSSLVEESSLTPNAYFTDADAANRDESANAESLTPIPSSLPPSQRMPKELDEEGAVISHQGHNHNDHELCQGQDTDAMEEDEQGYDFRRPFVKSLGASGSKEGASLNQGQES